LTKLQRIIKKLRLENKRNRGKDMTDKITNTSRRGFLKKAGAGGAGSIALLAGMNQSAVAQSTDPIVVGAPLPMTGGAAADGIEFRRGLEMAVEEINGLGGILGWNLSSRIRSPKAMTSLAARAVVWWTAAMPAF
jgi:ABC-type branched-subunit amino acid transport system substrate-binding protein